MSQMDLEEKRRREVRTFLLGSSLGYSVPSMPSHAVPVLCCVVCVSSWVVAACQALLAVQAQVLVQAAMPRKAMMLVGLRC